MNKPLAGITLNYTATNPQNTYLLDERWGKAECCNNFYTIKAPDVLLNEGLEENSKCITCNKLLHIRWYKQTIVNRDND